MINNRTTIYGGSVHARRSQFFGLVVVMAIFLQPFMLFNRVAAVGADAITLNPVAGSVSQGGYITWRVTFGANVIPRSENMVLKLMTSSSSGMFSDSSNGKASWHANGMTVALKVGNASRTFSYYDSTVGSATITATVQGGTLPESGVSSTASGTIIAASAPVVTTQGNEITWQNSTAAIGARVEIFSDTTLTHTVLDTRMNVSKLTPAIPNGEYVARITPLFATTYGDSDLTTATLGKSSNVIPVTIWNDPQASIVDIVASNAVHDTVGGIQTFSALVRGQATAVEVRPIGNCGTVVTTASTGLTLDTRTADTAECMMTAVAIDQIGNTSTVYEKGFAIDNAQPLITITTPVNVPLSDAVTIHGQIRSPYGITSGQYTLGTLSGTVGNDGNFAVPIRGLTNGTYELTVSGLNKFGIQSTYQTAITVENTITISIPSSPQLITNDSVLHGSVSSTAPQGSATATVVDAKGSSVALPQALTIQNEQFAYSLKNLTVPNGEYTLIVQAVDVYGNTQESRKTFELQNTVPVTTLAIRSSNAAAADGVSLMVFGKVSSPSRVQAIQLLLSDGTVYTNMDNLIFNTQKGEWQIEIPVARAGTYTYGARIIDIYGNASQTAFLSILVDAYKPPSQDLAATLDHTLAGNSVFTPVMTPKLTTLPASPKSLMENSHSVQAQSTKGDVLSQSIDAPLVSSQQGWKLFGVAWYWWLGCIAILGLAWYTAYRFMHRNKSNA